MLLLAALLLRLLPAGMMVSPGSTPLTLTVTLCSAMNPQARLAIPVERKAPGDDAGTKGHCAFTALGDLAIGGDLPRFIAAAVAFLVLLGFAGTALPRRLDARLRPPLRGPPVAG